MKILKKILVILTIISLVFTVIPSATVIAALEDTTSYEVRYSYTMNTYSSTNKINNFIAHYENESGEFFYPEYFSGFYILDDGRLAFLVTDDSDSIRNIIKSIVGEDVSFIKVRYSFNELYKAEEELLQSDIAQKGKFFRTSLNLRENIVDVYLDNTEMTNFIMPYLENSLFCVHSSTEWEKTFQDVEERIQPLTEDELYLKNELRMQDIIKASVPIVYPGVKTCFLGYVEDSGKTATCYGTTGFCALDANGNLLIVTHGHAILPNKDFAVLRGGNNDYEIVGKSSNIYYTDVNTMKDFAIIKLNSGIKISNRINNTSLRITKNIAYDYILESLNNTIGYGYGANNGERSGTLYTSRQPNNTYLYLKNSKLIPGDSGCPIYTKESLNTGIPTATLLGILKGTDGVTNDPWGCSIQTIKDSFNLSIFQNNTDY